MGVLGANVERLGVFLMFGCLGVESLEFLGARMMGLPCLGVVVWCRVVFLLPGVW